MRLVDVRFLETPPLRRPTDDLASAATRASGEPEARPAADAPHGPEAHPPEAGHQQAGEGAQDLPLPAPGPGGGGGTAQPEQVAPTSPACPGGALAIVLGPLADTIVLGPLADTGSLPWLVAVMDWHARKVLAWRLSSTLEAEFRVEAPDEAPVEAPDEAPDEALTGVGAPGLMNREHGRAIGPERPCDARAASSRPSPGPAA